MFHKFLILALLCLCSFGCALWSPSPVTSGISITGGNELIQTIYLRLKSDPVTGKLDLTAVEEDGIVTLYGRIDNAATRLRAVSIVRSVAGVRGVIDKTFQY